jgi:hypothetical protein
MQVLEQFSTAGILEKDLNGVYRLKKPSTIIIPKDVISDLKKIYIPNYEKGGIMAATISGRGLKILAFYEVPNSSTNSYSYSPNPGAFINRYNYVLDQGYLPIVIHTHPTSIGLSHYDGRDPITFQNSSSADRKIARNGIIDVLRMPEAIFVADNRLEGGFAVNFYSGDNKANIIGGSLAALGLVSRKIKLGILGGAVILGNYLLTSEKVQVLENGDIEVIIRM